MIAFTFAACDPVENNLNRMDNLVSDAESNASHYSNEDWEAFVSDYQECQDALESSKQELTQEDFRQYGSITARYQKLIMAYSMDILKMNLQAGKSFMDGYMDEIDVDNDFQSWADQYEEAFEELTEGLHN